MRQGVGALLLALLFTGCAGAPVERLRIAEIAAAPRPAPAELLEGAQLKAGKAHYFRLLPFYGPLTAIGAKVRAVGVDGTAYRSGPLADAWEAAGLQGPAKRLRTGAWVSEVLSPILFFAGVGVFGQSFSPANVSYDTRMAFFYAGLGMMASPTLLELAAQHGFSSPAIRDYNRALARRGRPELQRSQPSDAGALWRSALLPGWGQAYKGDFVDATVVIILQVLSLGSLNSEQGAPQYKGGAVLGVYAFNLLDAWSLPVSLQPYGRSLSLQASAAGTPQLALRAPF